MNIYSHKKTVLFFLVFTILFLSINRIDAKFQAPDQLDLMLVFAYPVSAMESVRQDLSQALYFSKDNLDSAVNHLEQAAAGLSVRKVEEQDDREYIQQIINQIDSLINSLEKQSRSADILDLCQQIQGRL